MKIKRALVSVSDKTGLVDFAKELNKFGVEIIRYLNRLSDTSAVSTRGGSKQKLET